MANITMDEFESLLRRVVREEIEAHENRKKASKKKVNTTDNLDENEKVKQETLVSKVTHIISHLNEKTGSNFNPKNATNTTIIKARLDEGYSVEDMINVIDTMCDEWLGTDMAKYLRVGTLFRVSKIDNYLNTHRGNKKEEINLNEYD